MNRQAIIGMILWCWGPSGTMFALGLQNEAIKDWRIVVLLLVSAMCLFLGGMLIGNAMGEERGFQRGLARDLSWFSKR